MPSLEQIRESHRIHPVLTSELAMAIKHVFGEIPNETTLESIIETIRLPNRQFPGKPETIVEPIQHLTEKWDHVTRIQVQRVFKEIAFLPRLDGKIFSGNRPKRTVGELRNLKSDELRQLFGAHEELSAQFLIEILGK